MHTKLISAVIWVDQTLTSLAPIQYQQVIGTMIKLRGKTVGNHNSKGTQSQTPPGNNTL